MKRTDSSQWWELFDINTHRFYYYNASTQVSYPIVYLYNCHVFVWLNKWQQSFGYEECCDLECTYFFCKLAILVLIIIHY